MGGLAIAQRELKKLREEIEAERAIRRSEAKKSLSCKNVEEDSSAEDKACEFINSVKKQGEEIKKQNNCANPIVIARTLSEKDFDGAIMTKNGWRPTVDAMELWLRNTYEGLIAAGCKIEILEDNNFSNQKGTQVQYKLTITL